MEFKKIYPNANEDVLQESVKKGLEFVRGCKSSAILGMAAFFLTMSSLNAQKNNTGYDSLLPGNLPTKGVEKKKTQEQIHIQPSHGYEVAGVLQVCPDWIYPHKDEQGHIKIYVNKRIAHIFTAWGFKYDINPAGDNREGPISVLEVNQKFIQDMWDILVLLQESGVEQSELDRIEKIVLDCENLIKEKNAGYDTVPYPGKVRYQEGGQKGTAHVQLYASGGFSVDGGAMLRIDGGPDQIQWGPASTEWEKSYVEWEEANNWEGMEYDQEFVDYLNEVINANEQYLHEQAAKEKTDKLTYKSIKRDARLIQYWLTHNLKITGYMQTVIDNLCLEIVSKVRMQGGKYAEFDITLSEFFVKNKSGKVMPSSKLVLGLNAVGVARGQLIEKQQVPEVEKSGQKEIPQKTQNLMKKLGDIKRN
jgi:hypothetical protein